MHIALHTEVPQGLQLSIPEVFHDPAMIFRQAVQVLLPHMAQLNLIEPGISPAEQFDRPVQPRELVDVEMEVAIQVKELELGLRDRKSVV